MVVLYGINNCDTVKKALKFMQKHYIEHEFVDFKRQSPNPVQLRAWVDKHGWQKVLNTRSTTWRELPEETRDAMDDVLATAVAEQQPTIIKRPVLEHAAGIEFGFDEKKYNALFEVDS